MDLDLYITAELSPLPCGALVHHRFRTLKVKTVLHRNPVSLMVGCKPSGDHYQVF